MKEKQEKVYMSPLKAFFIQSITIWGTVVLVVIFLYLLHYYSGNVNVNFPGLALTFLVLGIISTLIYYFNLKWSFKK